ncbi:hypothetical protein GQ457_17G006380 [Hibiscus cannabinus]
MSSRRLKLVVPPEMHQNPCLEFNNGDSSRVLCPKGIREYSLHVGDNSCRDCHVGSKVWSFILFAGYVKLNVNRAMLNFNAKGGIGGVLRGERGEILFQFSKLYGLGPPSLIELIAIKVGMLKFLESEWCDKFRLII